jgi:hypothetical protein
MKRLLKKFGASATEPLSPSTTAPGKPGNAELKLAS